MWMTISEKSSHRFIWAERFNDTFFGAEAEDWIGIVFAGGVENGFRGFNDGEGAGDVQEVEAKALVLGEMSYNGGAQAGVVGDGAGHAGGPDGSEEGSGGEGG
jgi:hypothetical protein